MAVRKKKDISQEKELVENEENFYCFFEKRLKPKPLEDLVKLAQELVECAENDPKCFSITYFLNKKRLVHTDFDRWVLRCPELARAKVMAIQFIAQRREIGGIEGKFPAAAIFPYMPMFSKQYKEHSEWRAALTAKHNEENNEPKIIVIEKFADPKKIDDIQDR